MEFQLVTSFYQAICIFSVVVKCAYNTCVMKLGLGHSGVKGHQRSMTHFFCHHGLVMWEPHLQGVVIAGCNHHLWIPWVEGDWVDDISMGEFGKKDPVVAIPYVTLSVLGPTERMTHLTLLRIHNFLLGTQSATILLQIKPTLSLLITLCFFCVLSLSLLMFICISPYVRYLFMCNVLPFSAPFIMDNVNFTGGFSLQISFMFVFHLWQDVWTFAFSFQCSCFASVCFSHHVFIMSFFCVVLSFSLLERL